MSLDQSIAKVYEARHETVRVFLEDQDLGALVVYSQPHEHKWAQTGHVSYLSGWASSDRVADSLVVVPVAGRPALLVAGLPYMLEQISEVSPIEDVRLVQSIDPNAVAGARPRHSQGSELRDFVGETAALLEENEISDNDIGLVGVENMSAPFYEALSREFGRRLRSVDDVVAEMRSIKSPEELEVMRHASHLGDIGFETMLEVAKPGISGVEVVAEMERAVRLAGVDYVKYWMASGPPTHWNDARIDLKPHERVLGEGDLMAFSSYVVYKGYWSHAQRTGTLLRPSESLEELAAIAREAQDAGIAKLRPGIPAGHVARAVREKAAEYGWEMQGGRVGHGIGLDYSELQIPAESNENLLQAGMTMVVHSSFSLPGSGKFFVPLGDVCHITADGPEFLMTFPRTLFLAGR